MPKTRKVSELENELLALTRDKAKYLKESRVKAVALSAQITELIAKDKAKDKIESMSQADRVAMSATLKEVG